MKKLQAALAIILFLGTGVFSSVNAQNKIYSQIRKELSQEDIKKIDEAKKLYEQAEKLSDEADKINDKYEALSDKKKAKRKGKKLRAKEIKTRIEAFDIYGMANKTKFDVYKKGLKTVSSNAVPESMKDGSAMESDANNHYKEAQGKRNAAANLKGEAKYNALYDANELELLAIEEQEIAYDIYLNYAKILELLEANKPPEKTEASGSKTGAYNDEGFIDVEYDAEGNAIERELGRGYYTDDGEYIENDIDDNANSNVSGRPDFSDKGKHTGKRLNKGIIFKVQIVATSKELTIDQLKAVYDADYYNNELINGLYKYTIGSYYSYAEAASLKTKVSKKVARPFIVAYKDGKRISIHTALKETGETIE